MFLGVITSNFLIFLEYILMKVKLMKLFGIIALTGVFAVGCGGGAEEKPTEEAQPEATSEDLLKQIEELKNAGDCKTEEVDKKLAEAEELFKSAKIEEAKAAYDEAKKMVDDCEAAKGETAPSGDDVTYTVAQGDHLWGISAKDEIYGNALQWPLIYKANADKINDPDLITPGQELNINKSVSEAEIEAAIKHARERGAWTVGGVEESDKAYTNQ
jgi:LysM repeat protein